MGEGLGLMCLEDLGIHVDRRWRRFMKYRTERDAFGLSTKGTGSKLVSGPLHRVLVQSFVPQDQTSNCEGNTRP